jgi:hypothetical protein
MIGSAGDYDLMVTAARVQADGVVVFTRGRDGVVWHRWQRA